MDILDAQAFMERLKAKQMALKSIDQRLAKELTRKQLLESIYQQASPNLSESSISNLSQSQISDQSTSSISSHFLQKEIGRVYQYSCNKSLGTVNQTNYIHKQIDMTKNTEPQIKQHHYKKKEPIKPTFDQLQSTILKQETTLQFIRPNYIKTIQLQEEKRKREKQMLQFLQVKQQSRKRQLQQQRLKVRQQLLKQQEQTDPLIQKRQYAITNPKVSQSNVLRIERTKALSHLLREVQKGKRNTDRLLEKTHIFTYS